MAEKPTLLDWLGLRRLHDWDFSRARGLGALLGFLLVALSAYVLYLLGYTLLIFGGVVTPPASLDARSMAFLAAALLGAPFVI